MAVDLLADVNYGNDHLAPRVPCLQAAAGPPHRLERRESIVGYALHRRPRPAALGSQDEPEVGAARTLRINRRFTTSTRRR
jgi:hypothetical protein